MVATNSEKKQLSIAWGTPIVLILLAVAAGKLGGPATDQPAATTLTEAHNSFHDDVSPPSTQQAASVLDEPGGSMPEDRSAAPPVEEVPQAIVPVRERI